MQDASCTFRESSLAPGGLAQDRGASDAEDDGLGVAEDGRDLVAAGALDVHEEGVGVLDQPLQLVLPLLILGTRVQEVFGEGHVRNLNFTGLERWKL